jgi:biopolymer transport protein ExbB
MRRTISAAGPGLLSFWLPWLKLAVVVALLYSAGQFLAHPALVSALMAQEETNPATGADPALDPGTVADPSSAAPTTSESGEPPARQRTIVDTIRAGGYIGVIIILLSMVAVGFIVEHALTIRKERLMPQAVMDQLEDQIAQGDLAGAIQACEDPRNYSLATDVVLAGLERYRSSEFGYAEYKSAVEEAGEDYTARLYRKTDVLSVIGAIAPMLGLFGTVEGMMESFNTIASRGGMARPDELADSIGKALVTTWLGLMVAIPAMVAFSYFRNKIDSIVSECGKRVERILTPLSRQR